MRGVTQKMVGEHDDNNYAENWRLVFGPNTRQIINRRFIIPRWWVGGGEGESRKEQGVEKWAIFSRMVTNRQARTMKAFVERTGNFKPFAMSVLQILQEQRKI